MATSGTDAPPIAEVLKHYGADLTHVPEVGWHDMRCPFSDGHANGDRTKSARVNLAEGAFACMACGVKGDAWALIKDREGLDFRGALDFARDRLGVDHGGSRGRARDSEPWRPSWLEL